MTVGMLNATLDRLTSWRCPIRIELVYLELGRGGLSWLLSLFRMLEQNISINRNAFLIVWRPKTGAVTDVGLLLALIEAPSHCVLCGGREGQLSGALSTRTLISHIIIMVIIPKGPGSQYQHLSSWDVRDKNTQTTEAGA